MGVRKNAVDLTPQERDKFIDALKALKNTSRNNAPVVDGAPISLYDEFVAMHLGVTRRIRNGQRIFDGGHGDSGFLPWHREYLLRYEQALQAVDPDVSLPYWDWTDHEGARDVIFQDNFMGPNGGPGGLGGGTVESGHFSEANGWRVSPSLHVRSWGGQSSGTGLIRTMRSFSALPMEEDVNSARDMPTYSSFRSTLERSPLHNQIHVWVGGSMLMMSSPNDPIFFMHHANVDRIWAEWQDNGHPGPAFYSGSSLPSAYGHDLTDRMWPWDDGESQTIGVGPALIPRFVEIVTPENVLAYRTLGYTYDTTPAVTPPVDTPPVPIPGELTIGEPAVEASISAPGQRNTFQLEVADAGRYRIETEGNTDVVMSLFGPNDRTRLVAEDDDSGERRNARIISQLVPGTYYVVVRHYRPTGTGSYRISVRAEGEPPVVVNGDLPITELTVGGPPVQASIGAPFEVDVFQFVVVSAGRYTVQTQGPTDIVMSLFGPNDRTDLVTTDDDSGQAFNAKIEGRLTAGTYYVEVRHYSPRGTGNYSVSIRAETEEAPELEVNGEEVQGEIEASNESDLYTFTAPEAGDYTIETSGITDTFLTLYGPDSETTVIARDDDSGPGLLSRIEQPLGEGTYYVRVRHYRPTGTGPYGILVRR